MPQAGRGQTGSGEGKGRGPLVSWAEDGERYDSGSKTETASQRAEITYVQLAGLSVSSLQRWRLLNRQAALGATTTYDSVSDCGPISRTSV